MRLEVTIKRCAEGSETSEVQVTEFWPERFQSPSLLLWEQELATGLGVAFKFTEIDLNNFL